MSGDKNMPVIGGKEIAGKPVLVADIRILIEQARQNLAVAVNAELTMLYWRIGRRIGDEILQGKRADYGAEIVSALGRRLTADFGRGFSPKSLRHMVRFAESFPDEQIVSAVGRQLSWTHFKSIIYFNRKLNRLIAIELKLGDFKAEFKGQMELYLRWLDKYERGPREESPLGIILCAGKKQEQIELLELGQSGIHVAEYLTALPDRHLLQRKLHDAIAVSRQRLENRQVDG